MWTKTLYKSKEGQEAIMAAYDAALSNFWPVHGSLLVPTRYGDTFVVVAGQPGAPSLVLLHGAGSNSAVWAGDAAVFSPHMRVYAVDLIGEPGKSAPTRPSWEGPAFAEWLGDVRDGLRLERVALLGISQGGWTALKFATAWPERVERLVLLAPGGVVKDRASFLLRAVGYSFSGSRGQEALKRLVLGDVEIPAELDEYLTLIMTEFKPRIGALPLFTDEELSRLAMPVLLIGGDRDVIRDEKAIAARLAALLPDVQTVILPGVGHTLTATTAYTLPFFEIPQAAVPA